jgi:hypothetical protein
MELKKIARPALLAALIAASGTASAVTWDFQTSPPANHLWGVSQSFDTNPASGNMITAFGFNTAGIASALFSKFSGAGSDETGLGLATVDPDGDRELIPGSFITLDMSGVTGTLGNTFTIQLGSLQGTGSTAENASIYECMNQNCTGTRTLLGTVSGPPTQKSITLTLGSGFTFFQIFDNPAGGGADVLLDSVSTSSVPEPATLGLLGLGLAGLGFMRRRKAS